MKTNSINSAFTSLRLLLALSFCLIGAILTVSALTSFGTPKTDSEIKTVAAKKKHENSGRRALAAKQTDRPGVNKDSNGKAKAPDQSTLGAGSIVPRVTEQRNADGQIVYSVSPSYFDISKPLSEMAKEKIAPPTEDREHQENELPSWLVLRSGKPDPVTQVAPQATERGPVVTPPTTGFNFLGVPGTGSFPSDENGSVGNDQYVETVNTRYQVWSLNRMTNTATSVLGPVNINTLWAAFGGVPCQTQNAGDPVVLYDKVANRWLISQFTSSAVASTYYQCVAISTTADATGTYARYAFAVPGNAFGDYPHYGVWTDAYYVMAHAFTAASGGSFIGAHFGAMDRTKMLAGDPSATWQVIVDSTEGGHMPADMDGFAPPPGNAPGVFLSIHGSGMYVYRMKVDFTTPANTVRPLQAIVPVAAAAAACGGGNCIPQPGSGSVLPALSDRLMFRAAYRNYIDHESLVVSHSVDPSITGVVSGVRWYEFRLSGTPDGVCSSFPCVYQQGTVADVPSGRSRWMPSIAMDSAHNMLLGYSVTGTANGSDNHSIRYTGRATNDTLGTMTAPETIIFTGTRNITGARWGDYTSMSADPADDCTFWYVNQYYLSGGSGSGSWQTRVASSRWPEGTGPGQCEGTSCTSRPASAPVIGTASPVANNQVQLTWSAITPAAGSYAIERAIGSPGSEGLYQPLAAVDGALTNFIDTTVQGGVTYTYRVIAATDAKGRCQALVRSGTASTTATGTCNLKPTFAGASAANSANTASCGVTLSWAAGATSCPLSSIIKYNIYRGTTPDFVPSGANRIATCAPGPSSYTDTNGVVSGNTYYYTVRAEDNSTGNGGPCNGGNEETNSVVVAGTPYGVGTQGTPGTWTDAGGDGTAFLRLNPGSNDQIWRFVKTADDAGANHTPGGAFAYRNAGPSPTGVYSANACASAETPELTVGSTSVNLTYWERHQIEKGWDGVAVEYSRNSGPWTVMTTPSNLPINGCEVTDVITDWATISCTGAPPANACGDAATVPMINGPVGSGTTCANWVTGALTAYGRRCHLLTGLVSGDTIKFRWRFTSDPAAEFIGFYLDDIAVTNILLPNTCTGVQAPAVVTAESVMTHGGAGTFGINLPLASRGIESRQSASGNYTIVVHFDQPVNGGTATLTGTGSAGTATFNGSDMTIPLTGVADVQTVTLTLNNVSTPGGGNLPMASLQIGFLAGDANGSGTVNVGDIGLVKSNSGAAVTGANFRSDVVVNGSINVGDVSFVKSRSGAVLPP